MLLAPQQTGVAGMFVVRPEWLDKRDGRQSAPSDLAKEGRFVLQMRPRTRCGWVERPVRVERRVLGVIAERLMMVLEQRISMAVDRVTPPARIPFPAHSRIVETVANRGQVPGLGRIDVVDWGH